MNYCDYCDCDDCIYGHKYLTHAQTVDGKWICDVCYTYEVCQTFPGFQGNPCLGECEHKPQLISDWAK